MKIFEYAKAVAGLVGAIATAVLAVIPPEQYQWLVIVGVIATTVAVYVTPNLPAGPQGRRAAGQPIDPQG